MLFLVDQIAKAMSFIKFESRQTNALQQDIDRMHSVLTDVCKRLDMPLPPAIRAVSVYPPAGQHEEDLRDDASDIEADMGESSPILLPNDGPISQAPMNSFINIRNETSPGSAPTGDLPSRPQHKPPPPDLISQGHITLATAERLARRFFSSLDHYIYSIGSIHPNLDSVRRMSPTLTACICAVAALHEPDDPRLYEICVQEYRGLVSKLLFNRKDIEYLRALCIGSFFMSDISRILSEEGIRRAVDLRLHQYYYASIDPDSAVAFGQANGKPFDVQRARGIVRLWYMLYICDQHLSILYNRPAIIHEQESISNWEAFLDSPLVSESDKRISSQVSLLLIMGQVRETFGSNSAKAIPRTLLTHINSFNRQLDQWLTRWSTSLGIL